MIIKTTLRLIKSTLNRFIAILAIVFIGVSFMMGLRSNYNIMQNSVEKYIDDSKLYDFQVYSNFGFDDNDIKAIKNLDYVDEVFASKTRDVYASVGTSTGLVTRVLELDSNLNTIELKEGRMPQKENECVMIEGYSSMGIEVGEKLTLSLEDEEISDSLKKTEFTIVGVVKGVEHMTETFTTSTLNSKDLNCIIYIPNSNFIFDYNTCLYLTIDGARDLFSFSDEYKDLIDEKGELISNFSKNQSQVLKTKIIDEATQKLEDAKLELEENRTKYQKELDDAKHKLNDAKKLLDDSKIEIENGEIELVENEAKLKSGEKELEEGLVTLKENEALLEEGKAELEAYGMSVDQLESLISRLYNEYSSLQNEIANIQSNIETINKGLDDAQLAIKKSGCNSSLECRIKIQTLDPNNEEDAEQIAILLEAIDAFEYVNMHRNEVVGLETNVWTKKLSIDALNLSVKSYGFNSVQEAYDTIMSGIEKLKDGEAQIKQGYIDYENGKKQIEDGYRLLKEGKQKLEDGKVEYEKGFIEYQKGLKEYNDGVEEFNLQMQDAEDQIEDGEAELADLNEAKWTVLKRYNTNYSFFMYDNTCEQMKSIGTIIPLLFFVVAALVCSTTMTRLIDEQRGQIGIYSALGFTKKEIISIYLLYVVIASLAASVVAIFVGVLFFPTIIYNVWRLLYDLPDIVLSIPLNHLVLCVSCFTVLMMTVTFIVINSSLKDSSAQLLRPKAPKSTKQILLEKWKWLWNKLPFTSKVTARNLFRYRTRFIMTVIGVAGCTSLLVMGFGIKDSINAVIELQFAKVNKYNYQVSISNDRHIDQILDDLKKDKNNEVIIPFLSYQTGVSFDELDTNITVNVIDSNKQDQLFELNYKNGKSAKLNDDGVLISDKFAKNHNLDVGDTIKLKSFNEVEKDLKIEGVVKNYVGSICYLSEKYYQQVFNEDISCSTIGVLNNLDTTQLLSLQDKYRDVKNVSDFSNQIKSFQDMLDALDLIILIVIVVAGALAFVVLINLTNVNISERIREIATLKVLGFKEIEVNSYIFKEVLLMSIVGGIIGLPLGNIEEAYIMTVIDMEMCTFPHVIHAISYVYAFVITIIFTVIVMFITRKTLREIEMVESLKSIE